MDFQRMIRSRQFWIAVFVATAGLFLGTASPVEKRYGICFRNFSAACKRQFKVQSGFVSHSCYGSDSLGRGISERKAGEFFAVSDHSKRETILLHGSECDDGIVGDFGLDDRFFLQTLFFFLLFFWKEEVFSLFKRTGDRICDFACPGLSCHFRYGKPWRSLRGME